MTTRIKMKMLTEEELFELNTVAQTLQRHALVLESIVGQAEAASAFAFASSASASASAPEDADIKYIVRGLQMILPAMQHLQQDDTVGDYSPDKWKAEVFQALRAAHLTAGQGSFTQWFDRVEEVVSAVHMRELNQVAAMQQRLSGLATLATSFLASCDALRHGRKWKVVSATADTFIGGEPLVTGLNVYKEQCVAGVQACRALLDGRHTDDWHSWRTILNMSIASVSRAPATDLTAWLEDITFHFQNMVQEFDRVEAVRVASTLNDFQLSSSIVTLQGLQSRNDLTFMLCHRLPEGLKVEGHELMRYPAALSFALRRALEILRAVKLASGKLLDLEWERGVLVSVNDIVEDMRCEEAASTSWVDWMRGVGDLDGRVRVWLHTVVPNELKVQGALWLWHSFVAKAKWPQPEDVTLALLEEAAKTRDPILFAQRAIRRCTKETIPSAQSRLDVFEVLMDCPQSRSIPAWFPGWDSGVLRRAPRMDPFLGLQQLRGVQSFMYLEPKPEWAARFPHLPILVLLGDEHKPDTCALPCDEALQCKRLGGPSHSFVKYLDESSAFEGLDPDFVYEDWVPKHHRHAARDPCVSELHSASSTLTQTARFLWDCAGPLRSPRCPLRRLRVHTGDVRSIIGQHTSARLRRKSEGSTTSPPSYPDLFGLLIVAGKQGQPKLFLDACATACPGFPVQDIVHSMFSLDPSQDIENDLLRGERVAHEFYQLDPDIQEALKDAMAPNIDAALVYPYDIEGAVIDWVQTCNPGQVMHPLLLRDLRVLVYHALWLTTRWSQAVDLYTLSRFLKRRKDGSGASKFVAIYLGTAHVDNIVSLVRSMYDVHAHSSKGSEGFLDLTHSKAFVQRDYGKMADEVWRAAGGIAVPDWPVVWDTADPDIEVFKASETASETVSETAATAATDAADAAAAKPAMPATFPTIPPATSEATESDKNLSGRRAVYKRGLTPEHAKKRIEETSNELREANKHRRRASARQKHHGDGTLNTPFGLKL
jgi:hypothetical protein